MLILNVMDLLEKKSNEKEKMTKYKLFNRLNNLRANRGDPLMNYKNFLRLISKSNKSVLWSDLDDLCIALDCKIDELITISK